MLIQSFRRAARNATSALATICGNRRRTWGQTEERVGNLSTALRTAGYSRGARIGILSTNSDHFFEALFAVWGIGASAVLMNTRWSPEEHSYSIRDANVCLLIFEQGFAGVVESIAADSSLTFATMMMGSDAVEEAMARAADQMAVREYPPQDYEACVFYTGGTTGRPKGVVHTHASLWHACGNSLASLRLSPGTKWLHAAPMFHLADLIPTISVTALAGCHVFLSAFSTSEVARLIREEAIDATLFVPSMIARVLNDRHFDPSDYASLKVLRFGGAPTSRSLILKMRAAFPKARLVQAFGQTETAATGTIHEVGDEALSSEMIGQSVGKAFFCTLVEIRDDDGRLLPPGEVGEIFIYTPAAMSRYLNDPAASEATLCDGWVRTGDMGHLDGAGYLFVSDRKKDMIVSGGENVFSAEVERALSDHPDIAEVAVIGVPDEVWGERVHAVVVATPNRTPTLESLQAHSRKKIAGYKVPKSMEIVLGSLPLSPVGKINKVALRALHWAGHSRQVN